MEAQRNELRNGEAVDSKFYVIDSHNVEKAKDNGAFFFLLKAKSYQVGSALPLEAGDDDRESNPLFQSFLFIMTSSSLRTPRFRFQFLICFHSLTSQTIFFFPLMETRSLTQNKQQMANTNRANGNSMKRSSSSNSDSHYLDSPHSPLRFHSPLRSDQWDPDPPESPPFASPDTSPQKSPKYHVEKPNSKAIVAVTNKFTQCSPLPEKPAEVGFSRAVREDGAPSVMKTEAGAGGGRRAGAVTSVLNRSRNEERMKLANLGFRLCEVVLSLICFSVMAADKTQGWSGDSFDRYREYRYCIAVNVIAFVYSGFQAYDLSYYLATRKHVIHHHLRRPFDFLTDQILAYLLISASSSAATRVGDWQSDWGKDEFTVMATASVAIAFLAFVAFALGSVISGHNLYTEE